ncbi:MAG: hypothetical protein ACHQE6_00610 [Solirubrobacterales bacterium]
MLTVCIVLAPAMTAVGACAKAVDQPVREARTAIARLAPAHASAGTPHAPSAPPLVGPAGPGAPGGEGAVAVGDASASAPASGGDPLVENGLGSPLCGTNGELSGAARRNCATSGFEAAGAPTGNYALDVHIDTGPIGLTGASLMQDYLVEPVWMGLVWVVHALVVALEWCFALDLLDSSAMGGLERSLRATQASFTGPWLVLALALASLASAYNGLVRRRVAETLGQAALTLAMMAGGLWVIADPAGTVGALGRWVDEASVGTLGAVVQGSPAHAQRTLAQSMGGLFAGVVGAPWCYLEFGNVGWCEDPARLEPRLRAAGLGIVAIAQAAHCASGEAPQVFCRLLEGEQPRALAQSAALLRGARTNGEMFLALPANEAARNSIEDAGSLLNALCEGAASTADCRGPGAAEAQFRTESGTEPRIGGLLLIAIGALGMILLLGFIALHLLGAEILSLFYLLLAPAAVIAPALGDGGRAAFRTWGTRLLGALCSKLLFSFLLGVVLLLTRTLMGLEAFGWWTRWLLVTVLWWGAYRQRHQVLALIAGEHRGQSEHRQSLAQRFKRQLEGPRGAWRTAQWARKKFSGGWGPAPSVERRRTLEHLGAQRARTTADEQVTRTLEHELGAASAHAAAAPEIQAELSARRTQLQRVQGARHEATAVGDTRRAARLDIRAQRIEGEIERGQLALNAARRTVAEGERAQRRTGGAYTSEQARERSRLLDAQAALPDLRSATAAREGGGAGDRSGAGPQRDYAALASLAGYGREQYERLDPRARREARLEIDRELALRRELAPAAGAPAASAEPSLGRRERRRAGRDFDRALEERLRRSGHATPRSRTGSRPPERSPREGPPHDARRHPRGNPAAAPRESPVMRDAREVARRRKRQLGG